MERLTLYARIKTWWSDDIIPTISDPMEEWFANWILLTYSDASLWEGQARPVRATLTELHYWAEQGLEH